MAEHPTSKIPAVLLVLVGLWILAWTLPQIAAMLGQPQRIGLLVLVPAFFLGTFDVSVGALWYDDHFTTAGPIALLSGHAVLFGPLLLRWGGVQVDVPPGGILLFAGLVVTGVTFLGFEFRRKASLRYR